MPRERTRAGKRVGRTSVLTKGASASPHAWSGRRWALLVGLVVILAPTITIVLNNRYRRSAADRIPHPPDLTGKTESCRRALEEADRQARAAPTSDAHVGHLGLLYHANHLYEPADRCYVLAMELNARTSEWPYYLACLREMAGRNEGVESLLRKVLELAPTDAPAHLRLADTLLKQNDFDAAATEYEKCLELSPDNPYARLGLARVAQARGDWPGAQSQLQRAVAADRAFGPAHRLLAVVYDKLGAKEQAEASRARANACSRFRAAPEPLLNRLDELCYDPAYLLVRADTAKQTFDTPRGVALLRRAVEVAPNDAAAHATLGDSLRELGDPEGARQHLARAIELDPRNLDARVSMGLLLGSQGDLQGAERNLLAAIKDNPAETSPVYGLGKVYFERGRREEAAAWFLKAAELSDLRFDDAIESYIICLMQGDRSADAIAFLQRVVTPRPTAARPRILLARVHVNREEHLKAVTVLRDGLASAPYNAKVASALAGLLAALPDAGPQMIKEAVEVASRAVDFAAPGDLPSYLDILAIARARAGDFRNAVVAEEEAVRRARQMNKTAEVTEFSRNLAAFQAGTPVLPPLKTRSATTGPTATRPAPIGGEGTGTR